MPRTQLASGPGTGAAAPWSQTPPRFRMQSGIGARTLFRKLRFFLYEGILASCQAVRQVRVRSPLLQYTANPRGQEPCREDPQTRSGVPGVGLQLLFAQGAKGIVCPFPFLRPHSQQSERLTIQYKQHRWWLCTLGRNFSRLEAKAVPNAS